MQRGMSKMENHNHGEADSDYIGHTKLILQFEC
jgi:hypothetical protein